MYIKIAITLLVVLNIYSLSKNKIKQYYNLYVIKKNTYEVEVIENEGITENLITTLSKENLRLKKELTEFITLQQNSNKVSIYKNKIIENNEFIKHLYEFDSYIKSKKGNVD